MAMAAREVESAVFSAGERRIAEPVSERAEPVSEKAELVKDKAEPVRDKAGPVVVPADRVMEGLSPAPTAGIAVSKGPVKEKDG